MRRPAHPGLFLLGAAQVQGETSEIFGREAPAQGIDATAEIHLLHAQRMTYAAKAHEALHAILGRADAFRRRCAETSRLAAGLEVTRIMGEVERAGLSGQRDTLGKLLEELGAFHRTLADAFRELGRRNVEIAATARKVVELRGPGPLRRRAPIRARARDRVCSARLPVGGVGAGFAGTSMSRPPVAQAAARADRKRSLGGPLGAPS